MVILSLTFALKYSLVVRRNRRCRIAQYDKDEEIKLIPAYSKIAAAAAGLPDKTGDYSLANATDRRSSAYGYSELDVKQTQTVDIQYPLPTYSTVF